MDTIRQDKEVPHLEMTEQNDLNRLENIIRKGLAEFMSVGKALLEIRERRLYRLTHKDFESYCRDRWGFTRQTANRKIAASQIGQLLEHSAFQTPETERQAREVAKEITGGDADVEKVREMLASMTAKELFEHRQKTHAEKLSRMVEQPTEDERRAKLIHVATKLRDLAQNEDNEKALVRYLNRWLQERE